MQRYVYFELESWKVTDLPLYAFSIFHFPSIIVIDIMLQKFKDVILVLVASPLQYAFNLHQTVPDHGHGSAT